jgi:hypothetical protein
MLLKTSVGFREEPALNFWFCPFTFLHSALDAFAQRPAELSRLRLGVTGALALLWTRQFVNALGWGTGGRPSKKSVRTAAPLNF